MCISIFKFVCLLTQALSEQCDRAPLAGHEITDWDASHMQHAKGVWGLKKKGM